MGLLAIFALQGVQGLLTTYGTCDELGAHLPAGILYWKSGEFSGGIDNPPLGQLLVSAGPVLTGTGDRPLRDDPRHLIPARLPVLGLGLVTVLVVFAWTRRLGGATAGLAALGACALSPNLVAHSHLATLDLPVTAFWTVTGWAAAAYAASPSRRKLAITGLAIGAACLTKLTALHLFPALVLGVWLGSGSPAVRARTTASLVLAGLAGLGLVAWVVYGPGEMRLGLPAGLVEATSRKLEHATQGHFSYLLGERSRTGFVHYYLVALAVKIPVAILLSALWGAIGLRSYGSERGRRFLAFAVVPAAWLLFVLSIQRVNIGLRHALPVIPVVLVLAGLGWANLWSRRRAARVVAIGLAVWAGGATISIAPHHLSYFNEIAGGPARGDRVLIDSNLDWGQDEGRLREWAGGRSVAVNPDRPVPGIVAANVNALHGILSIDDLRRRWLRVLPWERVGGYTWRIFEVDESILREAAASHPARALDLAWWLVGVGRAAEAIPLLEERDLSVHPELGPQWWRVLAEARLATGDLRGAGTAVQRALDLDLAAEIAFRLSESSGIPWPERSELERTRAFRALARRGKLDEARRLAAQLERDHPADVFPEHALTKGRAVDLDPSLRLARAAAWKEMGREAEALAEVGALLASDPSDEVALGLYGELVVRRKLGITEYPYPEIDWSGIP